MNPFLNNNWQCPKCVLANAHRPGMRNRPRSFTMHHQIGGDWPYIECECGKWRNPINNEHVQSMNLEEFLKEHQIDSKCPDNN